MNETARDFHLEELKQLRQDMAANRVRMETLAQRPLLVGAAVFSWIAIQGVGTNVAHTWCTKLPSQLSGTIWFLPFAYAVLPGAGTLAAYWRSTLVARYIRSVESALSSIGSPC